MAESEDAITNKRKTTPDITEEDATGKRIKLGDGHEASHTRNDDGEKPDSHQNGTLSNIKDGDGKDTEALSTSAPGTESKPQPESEPRHSPEARRPSASGGPPVRRNVSLEEKKRGQRLFGGLVSTLSRTTSGSQHPRRLEIERRQHEKAQQRRADDEKRRAERLEQLKRTRQIEQVKLDEQAMKTRHSAMLSRAHSLQTRSEPKLYYVPWELTKAQEETINDQIRAAEDMIERERRDFRSRKEQRLKALGVTPPPRSPSPPPRRQQQPEAESKSEPRPEPEPKADSRAEEATVGDPKPPPQDTNPDTAAPTPFKTRSYHHQDRDPDENGDEMMQDEEDVVIY